MGKIKHGNWISRGKNRTKEYIAWERMKDRCYNKNYHAYKYYGGKGVSVCKRWIDSFEAFLSDVGIAPTKQHSLDRYPNNQGNYEPQNVRWATPIQQGENKKNTIFVSYNNQSITIRELSDIVSIDAKTIRNRLNCGWSIERILSTQVKRRNAII